MSGEANQVAWRGVQPVAGIRGIWPAIDSVRVNKDGYAAAGATTVIYTVPVGKIFFLASALLTSKFSGAISTYAWLMARTPGDADFLNIVTQYYYVDGQATNVIQHSPALEFAAGYDFVVRTGVGGPIGRAGIYGWIEDA